MERSEFERLALEHLDAVYRMAMQLTRRQDQASDLVQETYLRALRSASRFRERGGGMRSWLFTILYNTFYTQIKKENRAPVAVGEFYGEQDGETAPDDPPPAYDLRSLDWEHVDERLKQAIDALPPDSRAALLLWGVEDLKYREIAEVLGVPIGTVMSRLHRARQTLAKALDEARGELGVRNETSGDNVAD